MNELAGVEVIAKVCHETNRAWCEALGDMSQQPWDQADEWQRVSAVKGVEFALNGGTAEEQHQEWCADKQADGWVFGDIKDSDAKTHPCLVGYYSLPQAQRYKDALFIAIVRTLAPCAAAVQFPAHEHESVRTTGSVST